MTKLSTYVSSRNNYVLLEDFLLRNEQILDYNFYNIDDDSDEDQKEIGREICDKYDIKFIENKGRGLQWAAQTMVESVDDDCEFILWTTHDTMTITDNFYDLFQSKLDQLENFGVIGFNIIGPQCNISNKNIGENVLGMIGRGVLTHLSGRGGWYRRGDMTLDWDVWGGENPIAIESPVDMILSFNVNLFKKYIKVTDEYHLFCAWDDICMQFLENDIYNVTLPNLQAFHNQNFKGNKIPKKSANSAKKGNTKHFGRFDHFEYWKSRWGWERDDVRETFPLEKYEGTLIGKFYSHDYKRGPMRIFDETTR